MTKTRTIHLDENGNTIYKKELTFPIKGRIFTIAYQVFPEGKVKYAGAVFNGDCKKELEENDNEQAEILRLIRSGTSDSQAKHKILHYAKLETKKFNLQNSHWNRSGNIKTALARLELRPLWTTIPNSNFIFNSELDVIKPNMFFQRIRHEVKHKGIKSPYRGKSVLQEIIHIAKGNVNAVGKENGNGLGSSSNLVINSI